MTTRIAREDAPAAWPTKWEAGADHDPPTVLPHVAGSGGAIALGPLRPALARCPQCAERLPTFVRQFGPVEIYCVRCGTYGLADAVES